jgi:polyferredoxin
VTDTAAPKLYAAREPIFPRRVSGKFRTLKWWILGITLGIYYVTPWIRWDRGPNLPDQAVLIDLASRRFYFFFIEIWPHEFYFVAGLLIMAGLGLFLFTAALGRVWCGYACPQTVWTDLFILVERWVEGDRNARVRLWHQPWNAEKTRKRAVKFALWFLIALFTGGAWVFYFADAPTLLRDLVTLQAPPVAYMTMGILTATTFAFGGFAREQICIYACPWPRIQAAMMDEETLTVSYRDWRGEPRGKGTRRRALAEQAEAEVRAAGPKTGGRSPLIALPGAAAAAHGPGDIRAVGDPEAHGDCIDCNACVNVCPTGVDIRDGQQMGCITCALCIDACDDVMAKIGKPRGLIDYITLADGEAERAGAATVPVWKRIVRPRVLLYFMLWAAIGVALVAALFLRTDVAFSVEPVRNPINVVLADGSVRNAYELRLRNMTGYDTPYRIAVEGEEPLALELQGVAGTEVVVPADATFRQRIYLTAPRRSEAAAEGRTDVTLTLENTETGARASNATHFFGTGLEAEDDD